MKIIWAIVFVAGCLAVAWRFLCLLFTPPDGLEPIKKVDTETMILEARTKVLLDRMHRECPTCNEFGVVMKYYEKSGTWSQITCPTCGGDGKSEEYRRGQKA